MKGHTMSLDVIATYLTEAALEDGGATVALAVDTEWNAVVTPTTGFVVGRPPHGAVFGPGTGSRAVQLRRAVRAWLDTVPTDAQHVGIWRDDATGRVHADVVDLFASFVTAYDYAKRRNEIAFYDLDNDREVRVHTAADH